MFDVTEHLDDAGGLSSEQLRSVVHLADEESDGEWARRAPNTAPVDLARLARSVSKPTVEDSRRRYAARSLRMWWTPDTGMLQLHGQLADVLGAKFEATIQKLTEPMKPAKGRAWDLPDGLQRVHVDDLTPEQAAQVGLPPPRAGPSAA